MSTHEGGRPVRRLRDGGDGSQQDGRLAALLAPMTDGELPPGMGERIWRRMEQRRRHPRRSVWWRLRWVWAIPALGAAAAALLVIVLRPAPATKPLPELTVVLVGGEARAQPPGGPTGAVAAGGIAASGSRFLTGPESRAFVRDTEFGALLAERTEALIQSGDSPSVDLSQGSVALTVAPRKGKPPFLVRARGYEVRVIGTVLSVSAEGGADEVAVAVSEGVVEVVGGGQQRWSIAAGECWSSASAASVRPCDATPEHASAKALGLHTGDEARLHIDGPTTMHVRVGAIEMGHPPIDWFAPAGSQLIVGTDEGETLAATLTLSPGHEIQYVFEPIHAKRAAAVAVSPDAARGSTPEGKPTLDGRKSGATPKLTVTRPHHHAESKGEKKGDGSGEEPRVIAARTPAAAPASNEPPAEGAGDGVAALYSAAKEMERAGKYPEAARALAEVAAGSTAFAELAAYEVCWIRLRHLADPAGAAKACETYRQRYPEGRLKQEADLNLVQALAESQQRDGALGEASGFLARYPTSERRREVTLLRAHLLCDAQQYEAARQAYRSLESLQDRIADDAVWYSAVCLAKAKRVDDARVQVEKYKARFPNGAHRAERPPVLDVR